jgi:hypothetical protein
MIQPSDNRLILTRAPVYTCSTTPLKAVFGSSPNNVLARFPIQIY